MCVLDAPCCGLLCRREWQAQLQDVLGSQCVGMLRLETGALKATYTNTLSSAQATIPMLMVVAGRRAAEAAIHQLQAVTRYATISTQQDCSTVHIVSLAACLTACLPSTAHRVHSSGLMC